MKQANNLSERSQQFMLDIQCEFDKILKHLEITENEIDSMLLKKIFTHHMHRSQESTIVLCKLLEDYQQGVLDSVSLLALVLQ